ncbi:hypothetical protein BS47DRAFT_1361680 [Hydnum rufescens UP504]|uniref:Cupredoxin n=1 Tax=Hydnum rufescens UP504 TaxID=1448309 RepID=A0A9P6AZ07_9AGAM|nr:hypothetical protein BS47DRAFT_1361680 [Hydnum rufescens UP504]
MSQPEPPANSMLPTRPPYTMVFSYIVAGLALVGASRAATVNIAVGANNAIAYSPPNVTASVGDTVLFTFMTGAHSVFSSTFADPCTPSGNISTPFHCQSGMVAAVNAPTTGNTFALYQAFSPSHRIVFQQIAEGKASAPTSSSSGSGVTTATETGNPNPYGPPPSAPPSGSSSNPTTTATTTKASGATLTRELASLAALVMMSLASASLGLMI